MAISFHTEYIVFPDIDKNRVTRWIELIAKNYRKSIGDLTFIFCDDEKILEINLEFLKHDFYTDIITFDYSENNKISGDIFISLDTVLSNSQKYQTNFLYELHRVIIHGILHLCGLNDKSEEEQATMRKAENSALDLL